MQLPFFYEEELTDVSAFNISEASSKHIVQVLRKKSGDIIRLTNGRGMSITAEILEAHKKNTRVRSITSEIAEPVKEVTTIAISLIKNTGRFEWFLEKATEIGISRIQPLICKRTEKTHYKKERMKSILISAMLQSQQVWLPEIMEPEQFNDWINTDSENTTKFVAHCLNDEKESLTDALAGKSFPRSLLIGPEGDFTSEEINDALRQGYQPVSLGNTRLRTETAALVAAVMIKNII